PERRPGRHVVPRPGERAPRLRRPRRYALPPRPAHRVRNAAPPHAGDRARQREHPASPSNPGRGAAALCERLGGGRRDRGGRAKGVAHGEADHAAFVISGDYQHWKRVIRKELGPIAGIMQRKLTLKGSLPIVVRFVKSAEQLVEAATTVPTRFLDE